MKSTAQIEDPSNILVVITRRIGDVLLTTPMIRSLRHAWPQARIDVLVFAGTEGVLAGNPDIDRVITVSERPSLQQHFQLLRHLWRGYDLALSMMPSDRPTLYAFIAGKYRVGLVLPGSKHLWKRRLLSRSAEFDNTDTHTVLMNLQLADLLGIPRCREVVAAWKPEDKAAVCKALPFDPEHQDYVVLHVYPMYSYKAWRSEAWVELIEWLNEQDIRVVLTGGKNAEEVNYVRRLMGLIPGNTVDVVGKLNLAAVAYLLSKARAFAGPDTVVTHLAAASGTPTVALFGPSNPVKWGPWPRHYDEDRNPYTLRGTQRVNNVLLLQGEGDCVPCMEEGCDRHIASLSDCLQKLPAQRVIDVLQNIMNLPY